MKRFCIVLLLLLLIGCGEQNEGADSYPHDAAAAKELIGSTYEGSSETASGEGRAFALILNQGSQQGFAYTLAVTYVGRSERPTLRTGSWYSDGETLTLVIEEQDGEPTEQPPLVFDIGSDGSLTAEKYDMARFDFTTFVMHPAQLD